MKIIFVRHGESEANVAGIINDDPAGPVALTENPILAALALSGKPIEEAARGSIPNCGRAEIAWPSSESS